MFDLEPNESKYGIYGWVSNFNQTHSWRYKTRTSEKKKLKRGRFGWGEQACPPWDSLDIPLSRTEGKAGWHLMRLRALHPKISMGHQLMCEEEAAASVEFPPERKKSSHADRSGKVGGEGGQKAEQTLGRKWDSSLISVWPYGSVSPSLAQASS